MKKILGVIAITLLMISCGSKKDVNKVSEDFNITIVSLENDIIKLNCTEGCAWIDLSFTLQKYQPQGVDAYGMTDAINTLADVSDRLPDFKFTIERTDNGVELSRVRDTGWNQLSFDCSGTCDEAINYDGMAR